MKTKRIRLPEMMSSQGLQPQSAATAFAVPLLFVHLLGFPSVDEIVLRDGRCDLNDWYG